MQVSLLAFGIARDILGRDQVNFDLKEAMSIEQFKNLICAQYPDFKKLIHFDLAINHEYQDDNYILKGQDEIAIIPPVSGG